MPRDIENPVIYYDPITKKKYTERQTQSRTMPGRVKMRLHTRIMHHKGGKKVLADIPQYYEVPVDVYNAIQEEYDVLGGNSERMWEIFESYPELLTMTPLEHLDWSAVSPDMYHSREHLIHTKKERDRILREAEKRFRKKHPNAPKKVIPVLKLYYRKRLRGGKRSDNLYMKRIKFTKFTTVNVRNALVKELDKIIDIIDSYYVVAERPSQVSQGLEYRSIVGKVDK